jgi:hypothetical protein
MRPGNTLYNKKKYLKEIYLYEKEGKVESPQQSILLPELYKFYKLKKKKPDNPSELLSFVHDIEMLVLWWKC